MELTESYVDRGVVWLRRDAWGEDEAIHERITIVLAQGTDCPHRCRVLPSEVLAYKTYTLPVIEHLSHQYVVVGEKSLRQATCDLLGEGPQHQTLHAWLDGLGEHVLGRDAAHGEPYSAAVRETTDRWPGITPAPTPTIAPRCYHTEPRHERLQAVAMLLLLAMAIPSVAVGAPLSDWRRLLLAWRLSSPLSFRTGRTHTPIGHVVGRGAEAAAPWQENQTSRQEKNHPSPTPNRTRSPPGASNRSVRSSTQPSDTRRADA